MIPIYVTGTEALCSYQNGNCLYCALAEGILYYLSSQPMAVVLKEDSSAQVSQ